jgi:hypothetical protein
MSLRGCCDNVIDVLFPAPLGFQSSSLLRPLHVDSGRNGAKSGHSPMAWRTDQIDPFATFRVAEQNDCFGAISGRSWVHFDSRSRARPSALVLGPTLSESEARVTSKDLLSSAFETPAPRGVASLVRAEWFLSAQRPWPPSLCSRTAFSRA